MESRIQLFFFPIYQIVSISSSQVIGSLENSHVSNESNYVSIKLYLHNQGIVFQMPDVIHTNQIPSGERRLENEPGGPDGGYPA